MRIIVLGSGTSHGIPVVGCSCPVCVSPDSRDKRMRSSVYIEGAGGEKVLLDAGPEFRLQAVRAGITGLDAIFLTHAHADHVHGLDDVRPLSRNAPIPLYGNEQTIAEVKERFSYIWRETQCGGGKPRLDLLVAGGPVQIGGLTLTPIPVKHGILNILGWEVEEQSPSKNASSQLSGTSPNPGSASFLYLTDTSAIPDSTVELLQSLQSRSSNNSRVIIIGGLRVRPHETHFTFEEAMNAALGLGAGKIFLTHICHNHFHEEIEGICLNFTKNLGISPEIHPTYDGLEINP